MKNVLKAILILAIMFNCATFGNYSVYADCSHVFGEYVITQKSGCTTTGSKYRVCKKCGYKSTVMIYPKGHNTKTLDYTQPLDFFKNINFTYSY